MIPVLHLLAPLARGHAYLDPGSGSMLIQVLLAALLGVGFAVKVYWRKIKALFSKNKGAEETHAEENETDEQQ